MTYEWDDDSDSDDEDDDEYYDDDRDEDGDDGFDPEYGDGLLLCPVCRDVEMFYTQDMCHSCAHQAMIDRLG